METMDKINKKFPDNSVRLASEGTKKTWVMRRELKSPNYTTSWADLPTTVLKKNSWDITSNIRYPSIIYNTYICWYIH